MDAVSSRIAPSPLLAPQAAVPTGSPAGDATAPAPAGAPSNPDSPVIVTLSEQARAALSQPQGDSGAPSSQAEDLAGLIAFEDRFKLLTEYAALHDELAWISDQTAGYSLDRRYLGVITEQYEGNLNIAPNTATELSEAAKQRLVDLAQDRQLPPGEGDATPRAELIRQEVLSKLNEHGARGQAQLDRYERRREDLLPRFAELARKLR